jgi:hypothetical protein
MQGVHVLVLKARYAGRRNISPGVSLERGDEVAYTAALPDFV